jgi:hypothetical protein
MQYGLQELMIAVAIRPDLAAEETPPTTQEGK